MKPYVQPIHWSKLSSTQKKRILTRLATEIEVFRKKVIPIIKAVQNEGDTALLRYNKNFEKVSMSKASQLRVTDAEFIRAEKLLSTDVKYAIELAIRNTTNYHNRTIQKNSHTLIENGPGIFIGSKVSPIDSVGMYIPRGKGSFPSMVYMLAIPAMIANVPRRVMVTPPIPNGTVDPACLFAAKHSQVHEVYKVGGAQSIAALAFGTNTIASVTKIIGPGSPFVTAAKQYVKNTVDIGLPAGPSESVIIADGTTPPDLVAYDLCIEAEHGSDSMSLLLTHKKEYAENVAKRLNKIIDDAPAPQKETLIKVFSTYRGIIITESIKASAEISNSIAPEHLMLHSEIPAPILVYITNAGEILMGRYSPFSLANYATGANAVIPTGGMARTYSPVSVLDFVKTSTIIKISKEGFYHLSPHVQHLAHYEGFHFHEKALAIRNPLSDTSKNKSANTASPDNTSPH